MTRLLFRCFIAYLYITVYSGVGYGKLIIGSGTKLTVKTETKQEIPSVYQLKTKDKPATGLPHTVCLVTDFPSVNTSTSVDDKEIPVNDIAVLDKSTNDVWRQSAVVWDRENPATDPTCKVKYGEQTVQPENVIDETTSTCLSLTVNERFQTNPGMNTLSVSVLGLRILTAKAIVFNLVITLRLWSS